MFDRAIAPMFELTKVTAPAPLRFEQISSVRVSSKAGSSTYAFVGSSIYELASLFIHALTGSSIYALASPFIYALASSSFYSLLGSSIYALEGESRLTEQISQLANIAVLETSEAESLEVFDLHPLGSRRVIVEVKERRPATFQFAAEEDELPSGESDPFEAFDLHPLGSHRVIVEVKERRPATFQFAAEEGEEETR